MKPDLTLLLAAGLSEVAQAAVAVPRADIALQQSTHQHSDRDTNDFQELWKRRGGGGGGGGRGGGGSSSGGSSSGGSSSGGGRSGSSSSGGGGGRTSSGSNVGGSTRGGSGPRPAYGGGRYYGGGAAVPYRAGGRSPSGIVPAAFLGAGVAALAFWPGVWLYGAYMYDYPRPYSFYNSTTRQNETRPITCGCAEYAVCGCDDNGDPQYLADLIGDGSYNNLNHTLVTVAEVNGTQRILINGTLPNGTTASGGSDDETSSATGNLHVILRNAGWWPVVATVCVMVFAA